MGIFKEILIDRLDGIKPHNSVIRREATKKQIPGQVSFADLSVPPIPAAAVQEVLPEGRGDNKSKVVPTIIQTGLKIGPDGSIKPKDFYVDRYFKGNGEPKYREELNRFDNIWAEYMNKREEMNSNGDHRNIFLILRGKKIEGLGKYQYISGYLNNDMLAVIKYNSESLNAIYSFSSRSTNIFNVTKESLDKNGNKRIFAFSKKADFLADNAQINLDELESVEGLKKEIQDRLTKKR